MLKKTRIRKMLLLLVVIVIANIYFGCVNKYYPPNYPTDNNQSQIQQQQTQIKDQDSQIKTLQKEVEDLKKQQK
jgi:cell division protein FtsL